MRQVYRKTRGRKRKQLYSDVYKPSVRRMVTDSVEALKSEVEICQNEIELESGKKDELIWNARSKKKFSDEMEEGIHKLEGEITD